MAKNTPTKSDNSSPSVSDGKTLRSRQEAVDQNVISAINQMFAEFELVFHNQYNKAFNSKEKEDWAKKLWYSNLKDFSAEQILDAAHKSIKESEFLPTVRGVIKYIESSALIACGLPDARLAYLEACNASHPKIDFHWSHPAVYLAGQQCGWLFLESSPEKQAFPIFQQQYKRLCEQVQKGEHLNIAKMEQIKEGGSSKMTANERKVALKKLRQKIKI